MARYEEQASANATGDVGPGLEQASSSLRIPDHDLIRRIGAGSYGEVWLARNVVEAFRAVKIVRRDQHESAESFEREFKGLQKFEPVSRTHDGLVDILTLGLLPENAGFYYVMELADGIGMSNVQTTNPKEISDLNSQAEPLWQVETFETSSLGIPSSLEPGPWSLSSYSPRTLRADLKAREALPVEEVIDLGIKLTEALAHLHAHGLVHRDVKPSNILFIGDEPKLADAGLVAAMDDARSLVGTAGYIAPEGPGTPQADLYALGKVLYEAAFGKDRQDFPALPANVALRSDHAQLLELNAIFLKACASNQRDRYSSAEPMRLDLDALLAGRSVKRLHAWQRILRHAKRFGIAAVALTTITASLLFSFARRPTRTPDFVWSANREAIEQFREGMRLLQGGSSFQAIPYFQRATELDPNFADAYAYLARAWIASPGATNQFGNAGMAARKAVLLNTNSALANSVLATVKLNEMDWAGADAARMRALALAPNSEDILLTSALNLAHMGRPKEALADLEKAQRVAPNSASDLRTIYSGFVYAWSGQYDRALNVLNQFPHASYFMKEEQARAYLGKDDYTNAIRLEREAALARGGNTNEVNKEFDGLEKVFKERGKVQYWKSKLELETRKTGPEHWMRMAAIHARLHQPDEAFENLRRARQETPSSFSAGINKDPAFESLRKDQRFLDMIAELWRKK